jgi:DNA-binding transcriptional ArsR family regulator
MSRLFRKSVEKVAQEAAAQAEINRLKALSVSDLAVELLSGLGRNGAGNGYSVRVQQLCTYLVRGVPGAGQLQTLELMSAVRKALDRLEQAELVCEISHQRSPVWRITRLGEATLADGTVRERINEGE